jgi:plastocyanin
VANYSVILPATGNPASQNANPGDTITFTNETGTTITNFATWTSNKVPANPPIFAPPPDMQTLGNLVAWTTPKINGTAKGGYTYTWEPGTPGDPRNGTIDVS